MIRVPVKTQPTIKELRRERARFVLGPGSETA